MNRHFLALAAAALLAGCITAGDSDRLGAQLAASDARLPGCIAAAGITGSYRVQTQVLGHGAGATVLRRVEPGAGVSEAQAAQATSCINA
ncbi:hypothetical protein [Cribrihabitans pelagius]|uniref:hypothetical protein n=1 Tax=Cribrihabitans pelagius TaxID=1765746 RepID=UPI003B59DB99